MPETATEPVEIYEAFDGIKTKPKPDPLIPAVRPAPTVAVFPVPDWWAMLGDKVRVSVERGGYPVDSVTFTFKGERWTPDSPIRKGGEE